MEMGELIKNLRIEKGLTQEELGNLLGLKKAAINKYESGRVENIKRSVIQKMAEIFDVSPAYLMGWEEINTNKKENNKTETSISIKEHKLLKNFNKLNEIGKDEAIKRVSELTLIPSYKEDGKFEIDTIAAHNDHLNEEGEMENIMKDLEDMDNW